MRQGQITVFTVTRGALDLSLPALPMKAWFRTNA
ncbi:MAG: hypothetical protein ACJAQS_000766 [Porticoccus sp.]|jgi:hypothetical protein